MSIPRRNYLEKMTREELQIRQCVNAIESLGAHPLLTDCVTLLLKAKDKLSDYVDLKNEG